MTFATAGFSSGLRRWTEDPKAVRKVLGWMSEAGFEPSTWSLNERGGVPFDENEVIAAFAAGKPGVTLRKKAPKMYAGIESTTLRVQFDELPIDQVPSFWALSGKLGTLSDPVIGHVQTAPARDNHPEEHTSARWENDVLRESTLLSWVHGDTFSMSDGIIGLAIRNYFGREYVDQIGRARLLATPGVIVEEEPNGAIRLDLHASPWECSLEEIVAIRERATAHLRPSGAISTFERCADRRPGMVSLAWTPGPNFRRITSYERTHGERPPHERKR